MAIPFFSIDFKVKDWASFIRGTIGLYSRSKKEKELIEKELKNSNKPKEIIEKISLGKIKKFKEDNSLMSQNWVMDPNQTVEKVLKNIDKDLKIIDFVRFKIG